MSARTIRASAIALLAAFAACDRPQPGLVSPNPPNHAGEVESTSTDVQTRRDELGEVSNDYPLDFERMVHVLTNLSRHAPINACDDFTQLPPAEDPIPPNTKLPPLVYTRVGNQAARFMSRHMAQNGCFQHESCCVLGASGGTVDCIQPAQCGGAQACQLQCTGGTPIQMRYALLGMTTWSGENIALGQPTAFDVWCAWMHSHGHRQNIYSPHTELGVGLYTEPGGCGPYWTQSFGSGSVSIPRIPVASAMYAPPNPTSASNLYFAANYYDPLGLAPKRSVVVVNGHCFDLKKEWGYADNGTYEVHFTAPDEIPAGCQPYYFLFVDGNADRWTYPDQGSLKVAIGRNTTCPDRYEPMQLPADCETGSPTCTDGEMQPCYTGPAGTEGKGECKAGFQVCKNGYWSSCRGEVTPTAEVCDGLDNNCDGTIDENNPGGNTSCLVPEERGECLAGSRQCIAGALVCVSNKAPQAEVCDGLDNDCDGVVDDGFGEITCGQGECFRIVQSCVNGKEQTCIPGTPSPEIADGRDNNCDGQIDDGIDCRKPDGGGVGLLQQCYSYPVTDPDGGPRPIIPPCRSGTQACQADGRWGPCMGEVGPSPEVCDGQDNDCNGTTDDLSQLGWNRCGSGSCTAFAEACKLGKPNTCNPKPASAEACDGKDNNCNGTIDESCTCRTGTHFACYSGPKYTMDAGTCHAGERSCVDGQWTTCQGESVPGEEFCNGLDENCNGIVDDNCIALPDAGLLDAGTSTDTDAGTSIHDDADGGSGGGESGQGCGCVAEGPGAGMIFPLVLAAVAFALRRRPSGSER